MKAGGERVTCTKVPPVPPNFCDQQPSVRSELSGVSKHFVQLGFQVLVITKEVLKEEGWINREINMNTATVISNLADS